MFNLDAGSRATSGRPVQMAESSRRFLLVVRAGDKSLHPSWLADSGVERNWDLHVSYYGDQDDPFPHDPADVTITREKGPKFKGLLSALRKIEARLDQYDYVGFPDDDLSCTGATWTRFFHIVSNARPQVAQPALSRRSFFSYAGVLQRPSALLRWTNFVEVMTPAFSRSALTVAMRYFGENDSGWGMDRLWPALFEAPSRTLCVVDSTPVLHTRAVGVGPLYKRTLLNSRSPHEEKREFLARHGLSEPAFAVYAAVTPDGKDLPVTRQLVRPLVLPALRQLLRRRCRRYVISGGT